MINTDQKEKAKQLIKEWQELGKTSVIMQYRQKGTQTTIHCLKILENTPLSELQQKEIARKLIWIYSYLFTQFVSQKGKQEQAIRANRFGDGVKWTIEALGIYTAEEIWKFENQGDNEYDHENIRLIDWKHDSLVKEILKQLN